MTEEETETPSDFDAVIAALGAHDRFLVTTHESPDGDALGSMLAATLGLRWLGKDVSMYLAGELPFPGEYALLPLDCANERRLGPDASILTRPALVLDVDHHHDNSRFGAVNLVVADASSTAEIVGDLLPLLGVALDPAIAEAL